GLDRRQLFAQLRTQTAHEPDDRGHGGTVRVVVGAEHGQVLRGLVHDAEVDGLTVVEPVARRPLDREHRGPVGDLDLQRPRARVVDRGLGGLRELLENGVLDLAGSHLWQRGPAIGVEDEVADLVVVDELPTAHVHLLQREHRREPGDSGERDHDGDDAEADESGTPQLPPAGPDDSGEIGGGVVAGAGRRKRRHVSQLSSALSSSGPRIVTSPAPRVSTRSPGRTRSATNGTASAKDSSKVTRSCGTRSAISAPVTPGTGSSRAGKTSRTTTSSASPRAWPNSSRNSMVREYRWGWKMAHTR